MSGLVLELIGAPRISCDGAPVLIKRRRALALLAYLALSGGRQSRESLCALLWPDHSPERAAAGLRQALWVLNSSLGPGWLTSDRQSVELHRSGLSLDVESFLAHIAAARRSPPGLADLEAAAALYRGEPLSGIDPGDSAAFAEWRFFQADGLRTDLAGALDALADGLAERGEHEPALAAARRRLALDPLHEPAQRRLMRLYADAGQRRAALRQYDLCAQMLRDELGAEPDAETQALHDEIRAGLSGGLLDGSGSPAPAPAALPVSAADMATRIVRLPVVPSGFVGREVELDTLARLLADPECRLVTLLGPGGIGKTRLALQAATFAAAAPRFADGVVFVGLTAVSDPALLLPTIAEACDVGAFRSEGLRQQLEDYLHGRRMLLLLDNLEQFALHAEPLAELLAQAPGLCLLTTSRERLGLAGEWVVDVDGLALLAEAADPTETPAVRLFVQAARRARPGFLLDATELEAVQEICGLVGGVPLAIELAAAWIRLMPTAQIAAAIRQDLDFLAGSARGLPERHRGLRAAFDHSWNLLDAAGQAILPRLTVFRGGFTLAAAAAVLPGASAAAILDLVDKSLVRRSGAERYDLHELLRQYAGERLAERSDAYAAAHAAHAAHYLGLLRDSEAALKDHRQVAALAAIGVEIDNIRAAWRYAVGTQAHSDLAAGLESLFLYYETASRFEEGEEMFGVALSAAAASGPTPVDNLLLGNLMARQGWFALRLYRFAPAQALLRTSLELLRPFFHQPAAMLSALLANIQGATGGRLISEELLHEQLAYLHSSADGWTRAFALLTLGAIAPNADQAEDYYRQSLALARANANQRQMAAALDALGDLARDQGDLPMSRRYWEESLRFYRAISHRWALAFNLDKLGYVLRQLGDYAEAQALHQESMAISREVGDQLGVAGSLDNLGLVALDCDDLATAETLIYEALSMRLRVGHAGSTGVSYTTLARMLLKKGDLRGAQEAALKAEKIAHSEELPFLRARSLGLQGQIRFAVGDYTAADACLRSALAPWQRTSNYFDQLWVLLVLAELRLMRGERAIAAMIAAAVLAYGGDECRLRLQAERVLAASGGASEPRPLDELIRTLLS